MSHLEQQRVEWDDGRAWRELYWLCRDKDVRLPLLDWLRDGSPLLVYEVERFAERVKDQSALSAYLREESYWIAAFLMRFYELRNAIAHDGWSQQHGSEHIARDMLHRVVALSEPFLAELHLERLRGDATHGELIALWNANYAFLMDPTLSRSFVEDVDEMSMLLRPFLG